MGPESRPGQSPLGPKIDQHRLLGVEDFFQLNSWRSIRVLWLKERFAVRYFQLRAYSVPMVMVSGE
jgi:hypothetical protein